MSIDFEIKQESFSGPLHLLLDLIQKEELPITEISLAQVAEDYLKYVEEDYVALEELADFLLVATRLLYIKSKAILPVPVVDDEVDASLLANQLKMYQEFIEATKNIEKMFTAPIYSFARAKTEVQVIKTDIAPPKNVGISELYQAFKILLKKLEPFFSLHEKTIKRVVSVQQRIGQIKKVIQSRTNLVFSDLIKGSQSKVEVVISFLALLELVKNRLVKVDQKDGYSDIHIKSAD